jgi:hypothetical protein
MNRTRLLVPAALLYVLAGALTPAHAQFSDFGKKLKQKVEQKIDQRVDRKTDKAVDDTLDKVECAATDTQCFEKAKAEGKQVKTVAAPSGSAAEPSASPQSMLKPGQGAWANYDFKPGDRIILAKNDSDAGGHHHSIPSRWIQNVDDKVTIRKTAEEAKREWRDEENNRAMFGDRDDAGGTHNLNRSFSGTY